MHARLLITGGSGLLACNWALSCRDRFTVFLAQHQRQIQLTGVQSIGMNLASVTAIQSTIEKLQTNWVVHTAGLTSVEQCEANPVLANHVNVELAENVALACAYKQIPLVHISTDHLFSGDHSFTDESASVEPINAYARSKADAEVRVRTAYPDALIVRTNFYGWGLRYRQSFSDWIIHSLRNNKPITLFQDVFFTPVIASELSRTIHELLEHQVSGIFNVVGEERLSKYSFGCRVAERFELSKKLILPGRISENAPLVKRPLDMSLSNQKVRTLLARPLGEVSEHLDILHRHEISGVSDELAIL